MTSWEATIYQLKNLKGKPLKQKVGHILTYFWLQILIVGVVLGCAVSYIVHIATVKDIALNVTCVNAFADPDDCQAYMQAFAAQSAIDPNQHAVYLSTNVTFSAEDVLEAYNAAQILGMRIAAQDIDVLTGETETLTQFFYQDIFADLTTVLSPEQQEKYCAYYLYMDLAVLQQTEGTAVEYPDPSNPESMREPIPVALRLPEDAPFSELCFPFQKDGVATGIIVNSVNLANALEFLDYVME